MNFKIHNLPPLGKILDPFNGIWQNSEKKSLKLNQKIFTKGIRKEVQIIFDKNKVPHIDANNSHDLYFAMGYLTARDRLWSIDFGARAAEGRLSEIFGYNEKILHYDIYQRKKCISIYAKKCLEEVMSNEISKKCLEDFSEGINFFIKDLKYKNFPIEYKLLDYKPENWSPYKTILLILSMADKLSGKDSAIEYTNALNLFGRKKFNFLYPDFPKGIDPIISQKKWNFEFNTNNKNLSTLKDDLKIKIPNNTENEIEGSNNWVLSKKKTADKSILLANDPHLDINLPSTFYVIHLKTPEINVIGGIGPGTPFVIIGNNENIAFGLTNSLITTRDWYYIKFRDDNFEEYKYGDIFLKTSKTIEEIKIRNRKSFFQKIIFSHYGPVFISNKNKREGLALKWSGKDLGNIILGFLKMNFSKSYNDFVEGLKIVNIPANYAFATIDDDIGMYITGKYPIRFKEQGKFILKGYLPTHELNNYIPYEHCLHEKNPSRGYVYSANQHPVFKSYPYYLFSHKYRYFRNLRIKEILDSKNDFNLEDMKRMQMDTLDYSAKMMLPIILPYINKNSLTKSENKAYEKLKNWDYRNDPEYFAPSIFREFQKIIYINLWEEILNNEQKLFAPSMYRTIQILKNHPNSQFLNYKKFKNLEELINLSFKQALKNLKTWSKDHKKEYRWADYRNVKLKHIIPSFKSFGIENLRVGGSKYSLCANEIKHGVSFRYIAKIKNKKIKSFFSYPGGQNGNPGNHNYSQYLNLWTEGKYLPLDIYFFNQRTNYKKDLEYIILLPKKN